MSRETELYHSAVRDLLDSIAADNGRLEGAAREIAREIAAGGLVHVIGTGGHSNMGAEELLWRAGGLAPINALLDAGTNLIHGAKRSNLIERTPGYARQVLEAYQVGRHPGEVIIIVNAYGINAMTIDTVEEARRRKMVSIAVTSRSFADSVPKGHPARHPSGKNLYQEADYFIDCHLPMGDAVVPVEGTDQKAGPTATLCNVFALNLLMIEAVRQLTLLGVRPPLWMSANLPGGDESNRALEEEYRPRIRHL
ncbi:MAG TPA: sugar isomerase domain-containing protein [Magnetospirillaceae bacterium]|nr:sugar isomerase domain-containing protein [Magnetospirillaceae bacterium]